VEYAGWCSAVVASSGWARFFITRFVEAFMQEEGKKREFVELELKYCERCGGLWFRRKGEYAVYCGPCVPKVAEAAMERHIAGMDKPWLDDKEPRGGLEEEIDAMLAELERLMELGVEGGNA
jgi:Zn-finger nucleic acid-binding protein